MNRAGRLRTTVVSSGLLCALTGCPGMQQSNHAPVATRATIEDAEWPYWPELMQIHPLTRITVDRKAGGLLLEARAEFLDADGVNCRAYGQLLLELTNRDASDDPSALSKVWTVDLRDLKSNATHFDKVTRTYLFRLEILPEELPRVPELRITFQGVDGATMSHRRDIRPYVIEPDEHDDSIGEKDNSNGASEPQNVPIDVDDAS